MFCLFWTDLLWGEDCIDLFVAENCELAFGCKKMEFILMVATDYCGAILSVSIIKRFTTSWCFVMSPKSREKRLKFMKRKR